MAKTKVTPELFEKVKKYLSFATVADAAEMVGLGKSTVGFIKNSDTYEDYLEWNNDRRVTPAALARSNVQELSGEPLFWEVHSNLANVPIKHIARKAGLSQDEVGAMKRAVDYEDYLKNKETYKYKGTYKYYNNGKSDPEAYARAAESMSGSEEKRRLKKYVNSAIREIIVEGVKQGITQGRIAKELGISKSTVTRAFRGLLCGKLEQTKKRWESGTLATSDKAYCRPGEDFYLFSLRKYLGLTDYPYWWKNNKANEANEADKQPEQTQPALPSQLAESEPEPMRPEVEEKPAEKEQPDGSQKLELKPAQPEEKPDSKNVLLTVPAEIKQNGRSFTLTININLTNVS